MGMGTKVISVINEKGGVGKTTTAVNLSYFLVKIGKSVLLVDLDPSSNVNKSLGIDPYPEKSAYDLFYGKFSLEPDLVEAYGIKVIPGHKKLADLQYEMAARNGREKILKKELKKALAQYKDNFDYIIFDCPPSRGFLNTNAMVAATDIYAIVQAEYLSMQGFTELVDSFNDLKDDFDIEGELSRILVTMYQQNLKSSKNLDKEFEDSGISHLLFKTKIRRNTALSLAQEKGLPIGEYDDFCYGALDYGALALEVVK